MKVKLDKLFFIFAVLIILSACSTYQSDDNYFGYNNRPVIEKKQDSDSKNFASTYSSNDNYVEQKDNSQSNNQSKTIVENNYYFFHPLTHYGYYPWWAPPINTIVYAPLTNRFYLSFGYGYYYDWYYYYWNYPYHHTVIYYPYPVYVPYRYYYYYPYYHPGWYPEYKNISEKPRKDTYRDFGPNRGSYTNTGFSREQTEPKNKRTSIETVPTTSTGTKTLRPTEPVEGNNRTPAKPTDDVINRPNNQRTRDDNVNNNEIRQSDRFFIYEDNKENSQKGENNPVPLRQRISEPNPNRETSPAAPRSISPAPEHNRRSNDQPARSSGNSQPSSNRNENEPANKRSR